MVLCIQVKFSSPKRHLRWMQRTDFTFPFISFKIDISRRGLHAACATRRGGGGEAGPASAAGRPRASRAPPARSLTKRKLARVGIQGRDGRACTRCVKVACQTKRTHCSTFPLRRAGRWPWGAERASNRGRPSHGHPSRTSPRHSSRGARTAPTAGVERAPRPTVRQPASTDARHARGKSL